MHIWCVAPTYALTDEPWRLLKTLTPKELITRTNETNRTLELQGDVLIELKSADTPERLVGADLDLLVLYEAALLPELAWTQSLRPRLASPGRAGLMIASGCPKGRNFFHRLFLDGQDPQKSDIWSMNEPMSANPLIDPAEVERMREELPDRAFRQEVLGEFVDSAGGVFHGVRDCIVPEHQRQGTVTIGIDWGISDYTVCLALDEYGYVCALERWNQRTWSETLSRIVKFIDMHGPVERVVPEATRADSFIVEELTNLITQRGMNVKVDPFKTTGTSKPRLIDALTNAIEKRYITFPDLPVLVNELELYEFTTTASGQPLYSAPKGSRYHDDCVMALAFALYGVELSAQPDEYAYAAALSYSLTPWDSELGGRIDTRHYESWYGNG